jgi:hypothetical protein
VISSSIGETPISILKNESNTMTDPECDAYIPLNHLGYNSYSTVEFGWIEL